MPESIRDREIRRSVNIGRDVEHKIGGIYRLGAVDSGSLIHASLGV